MALLNARRDMRAKVGEIDANIMAIRRERQRGAITDEEMRERVTAQVEKKKKVLEEFQKRVR